jgi:hypothetical protein
VEHKHSVTGLRKPCLKTEESFAGILGNPIYVTADAAMVTKPMMDVTSNPLLQPEVSNARPGSLEVQCVYGDCTFTVV